MTSFEQKHLASFPLTTQDDASLASDSEGSFPNDVEGGVSNASTHSTSKNSESGHSSTDQNTPEALVRRETRAVNFSRVVVILILIGATVATAYSVFRFTRQAETDAYDGAFDSVADKLTSSLVSDTSLKVRSSSW